MKKDDNTLNAGGSVAYNASQSQTSKYTCGKNGSSGHGFAAEDANALADILKGNNVDKVGTDNSKNGADRITNGIKIQSKYYKTASQTVNAAFDDVTGMYKYRLKNGRPMKLEVPKDQYEKAVQIMRQKISEGRVKGVKNPDHATQIIRKGIVTAEQAIKITQAGTIESLIYDAATGAVSCAASGGISAVITFALMKKNGASNKEALLCAGRQGGKAAASTLVTQVSVGQLEKLIVQKAAQKATETAVKEGSRPVANNVLSSLAKSSMRTNVVTALVTTAVTTIPEVNKARKGEISWGECGERATTNAGSVVAGIAASVGAVSLLSNPVGLTAIGVSLIAGMGGSIVGSTAIKETIKRLKKK